MEEKKVNFTLGASAGPGVPVKPAEDKKPAEIVPAKPAAIATVPDKAPVKAAETKKEVTKPAKAKAAKKAPAKKAKKPAAKKATASSSLKEEIKALADAKKPAVKKPGRPKKTETAAVKATVKKTTKAATTKKTTKASTTKKAATTRKATSASVKAVKANIVLQFGDANITADSIVENAKKAWAADGKKGTVRSLDVYVKPEDGKAYYVVNKDNTGSFDL